LPERAHQRSISTRLASPKSPCALAPRTPSRRPRCPGERPISSRRSRTESVSLCFQASEKHGSKGRGAEGERGGSDRSVDGLQEGAPIRSTAVIAIHGASSSGGRPVGQRQSPRVPQAGSIVLHDRIGCHPTWREPDSNGRFRFSSGGAIRLSWQALSSVKHAQSHASPTPTVPKLSSWPGL
jgi:hypothetical protein